MFGWDGNPLRRRIDRIEGARAVGRWMLSRRRLGGWDEAGQAVGPQWARHG
jgi:hypothetical protein